MNRPMPPTAILYIDAIWQKSFDVTRYLYMPLCPVCHRPCFVWEGLFVHEVKLMDIADIGQAVVIIEKGCEIDDIFQ